MTYAEFYARVTAARLGAGERGDRRRATRSSVLLANTPPMLEAHHGVPMTGGVLNAINTRLDAASIAFMLDHARGEGLHRRPGVRQDGASGAGAGQGETAADPL